MYKVSLEFPVIPNSKTAIKDSYGSIIKKTQSQLEEDATGQKWKNLSFTKDKKLSGLKSV